MKKLSVNSSDVVCETIDGEVVIVNLQKGDYYSLQGTASDIWNIIERGSSREELIKDLVRHYHASSEEINKAVDDFVSILQAEDLISVEEVVKPSYAAPTITKLPSLLDQVDFVWPQIEKFTDMEDLLLLDPIHEADQEKGWPTAKDAVA